jgi:hypothetical protein
MDLQPLPTGRGTEKSELVAALKKWKGSEMPIRILALAFVGVCAFVSWPAVFSQSQSRTADVAMLRERAAKLRR